MAQCLLVISEDNPNAWRVLNHFAQDIVSLVTNLKTDQSLILRTVAAAILSNVPSLSTIYINQIFDTLNQALDVNHRSLLAKLTSSLPLDDENHEQNGVDIEVNGEEQMEEETEEAASARRRKQDLPTTHDMEIKYSAWVLEAQRIAAETITNLCTVDDNGKTDPILDTKCFHHILSFIFLFGFVK